VGARTEGRLIVNEPTRLAFNSSPEQRDSEAA